jgi:hypothetical protein
MIRDALRGDETDLARRYVLRCASARTLSTVKYNKRTYLIKNYCVAYDA